FYLFLIQAMLKGGRARLENAPLTLAAGLVGTFLLSANNLVVLVIALPTYILLAMSGPSTGNRGQATRSGLHAIGWSALVMVLMGIGAGLIVSGGGSLSLTGVVAGTAALTKPFYLGWSLIGSVLLVLLFLFPCSFLLGDFREARDWQIAAVFRIGPSLVFSALVVRWCSLIPGFPEPALLEAVAAAFALFLALIILSGRGLLFVVHALSLLPAQLWLWGLSDPKTMPLSLAGVFFASLALPRLIFLFERVGADPSVSIQTLNGALRAASFGIRLEVFAIGVTLMPLGTFLGFNFLVQKPLLASICGASLTLVIVLFMGRALEAREADTKAETRLNQLESAVGVILLVSLIVLGIYPTPLYNYIHHLTQHP
ncbi:MAG TPA: hypothetical protein VFV50_05940, partial [Bdellovibrionales bacterium]|nr:hypothetical protein [Bdellovibrionales bacterium]